MAYGAAIFAGILEQDDELRNIVVIDAIPLTLGIETVGGVMTPIIPRGSVFPARKA